MSYELAFHPAALAEWHKLDPLIRSQFKHKLAERLQEPDIPGARVSGGVGLYKIKLRTVGYRLVYQVQNAQLIVLVLSVGKREGHQVYDSALRRLGDAKP
jgi:mRNA interferase RelE/StbE